MNVDWIVNETSQGNYQTEISVEINNQFGDIFKIIYKNMLFKIVWTKN